MTGMEHAIEQAARALYAHRQSVGDFPDGLTDWGDLPESWRDEWREAGEHVVRALAEAGLITPAPLHVELRDSGDLGLTPGAFTQHRYATAWDDGYNAGKNDLRDGHVFRTRNPHREADQ